MHCARPSGLGASPPGLFRLREAAESGGKARAVRRDRTFAAVGDEVAHAGEVAGHDRHARGHGLEDGALPLVGSRGREEEEVTESVELGQELFVIPDPKIALAAPELGGLSLQEGYVIALADVDQRHGGQGRRRLDCLLVAPAAGDLRNGSREQSVFGQAKASEELPRPLGRPKSLDVDDGRQDGPGPFRSLGDLAVGVRKGVGAAEDQGRERVRPGMSHMVQRPDEANRRAPDRECGDVVVVRPVGVNDIELLTKERLPHAADLPGKTERPAGLRFEQRPSPAERVEPSLEGPAARERELGLEAGCDERRRLIEDDCRDTRPAVPVDQLKNPHERKLAETRAAGHGVSVGVPL